MKIADMQGHVQCFHFDTTEKPTIESVKIAKGSKGEPHTRSNEILFFIEGRMQFFSDNFPEYEGMKGLIIFLPAGGKYEYTALSSTELIVFRVYDPIRLCDNFTVEKLYASKKGEDTHQPRTRHYSILEINARVWHLLDGIGDCLSDGVKCSGYFDLKVKEFFLMLCMYYPKEDIRDFLYLILSGDTAFSEYVRQKWRRFRTVAEMADSLRMTPRQFSTKFKEIFEQTPYRWMTEGRAKIIREQLTTTTKPLKQIALENGFGSVVEFTKFCKKELGATPTGIRDKNRSSGTNC